MDTTKAPQNVLKIVKQLWLIWQRVNVILGWPILLAFDIGLAICGYDYTKQRKESRRALKNIWAGREPSDSPADAGEGRSE